MSNVIPWIIVAVVVAFMIWRRTRGGSGSRPTISLRNPTVRNKVALIAVREVRQRVRGRTFRVVTVLLLVGVAAAIVIPTRTGGGGGSVTHVGVVGSLPASTAHTVGTAVDTRIRTVAEPDAAHARADLRSGRIDVAVIEGRTVVTKTAVTTTDTSTTAQTAQAIAATIGRTQALQSAGLSAAQIARLAHAHALPMTSMQPAPQKRTVRTATLVGVILLFVMLSQYNTWTLIGVMEEKSSRVVEVLLATVRPIQLLAGKLLGIGAVVFAQAGLVVGFALALAAGVGSDLLNGAGPVTVLMTLMWLVLGYAFYSWVYAAAGSMAERQDQVQSLALPIALPMILGYIYALTVAGSGNTSVFFDVLAYFPPTAPFAMPVLVGLGDAAWWQVLASVLISLAGTLVVARLAARVYQRAVLRTGRRVRIREVLGR